MDIVSTISTNEYITQVSPVKTRKAQPNKSFPDSNFVTYELFRDAMDYYDKAVPLRPEGNDDAVLRWHTCVRLIMRHKLLAKVEDFC